MKQPSNSNEHNSNQQDQDAVNTDIVKFLTCGSVDDGKSTLIGRLLHDSKALYSDQIASLQPETEDEEINFAKLVDGLHDEQQQGITIDVAYRYFSTPKRHFIITDTPGHVQYTRNMVTGASTCNVAVILIDARLGVLTQTKRHSFLISLLGIQTVIVAINKMDLVSYSEVLFTKIKDDLLEFFEKLNFKKTYFIPISALNGDNVVNASKHMAWYTDQTLMGKLESVEAINNGISPAFTALRFPVQWVNRPDLTFRGYSGTLTNGTVASGDKITILPSLKESSVNQIFEANNPEKPIDKSRPLTPITITLEDEIDISRGDLICHSDSLPTVSRDFTATIVWMHEDIGEAGQLYTIKHLTRKTTGFIRSIEYSIDINTLEHKKAKSLNLNDIAHCQLTTTQPLIFDAYQENHQMGAFILINRLTNATVAAGMLHKSIDITTEKHATEAVTREERKRKYKQSPLSLIIDHRIKNKDELQSQLDRSLFDLGKIAVKINQSEFEPEALAKTINFINESGLICLVQGSKEKFDSPSIDKSRLSPIWYIKNTNTSLPDIGLKIDMYHNLDESSTCLQQAHQIVEMLEKYDFLM